MSKKKPEAVVYTGDRLEEVTQAAQAVLPIKIIIEEGGKVGVTMSDLDVWSISNEHLLAIKQGAGLAIGMILDLEFEKRNAYIEAVLKDGKPN